MFYHFMHISYYFLLTSIYIFSIIFFRSSLIYNTSARHERRKCHKSETRTTEVLHEWHECDMSATRTWPVQHGWKILIFATMLVKTYFHTFHTPLFIIWQVKDYMERNNFILRTTFWKWLGPMPKCIWKVQHKNGIL